MKLMFIGAHPDDGDGRVGGLACRYIERGGEAMFVSVTNGNAGHHEMAPAELAARRAREAHRAGQAIGARYLVLDHDDARLTPTVPIREELIGLIREFRPDLLLGLRPFDYHADHRAAGRLVVDASYLLTVPLVRPDIPIMERMPTICYTYDGFQKPVPFRADVVVGVDEYFDRKVEMLACHESQVYEWLPFNGGYLESVPTDEQERQAWFRERCALRFSRTADLFRERLIERYGSERGSATRYAEVFEICEYGRRPDEETIEELFPA
ncbi:MAG: PIG-L deacetylase family protein [Candidatus Brocadiaceae bacterium]|jgi:LmbE family N-acetylglucosaminyl deacetylase